MEYEKKRPWDKVGMGRTTDKRLLETLRLVRSRIGELEREASRLQQLRDELVEEVQDYQGNDGPDASMKFAKFTAVARTECLRIIKKFNADSRRVDCKVLVVKVPVFMTPKFSAN